MMSEQLKTAVIVEDDPDIRHLLVEVLEAAGFSTVSVGNGIDGIQAVLSYRPLLTTLDVNMPGIDGFEAARRIRAQSDTYIIMLTGLSEEADVVLGLGAGADEYIVKPFRPREFRARVDALLRRPRAAAPQQTPQQDSVGPSFPGARPAPSAPAPG
ncbi:response regulator transcription factor, partial [Microbacterium sp. AISO3]|uniref:response regulator transcription factor n=2 Tax=unclassified Microbacterium TaxID=2609290 RepID=UPI0015534AAF